MMTLEEIHALELQVRQENRRVREQISRHERLEAEISLRISHAVMQYQIAVATCWAIALGSSQQQGARRE